MLKKPFPAAFEFLSGANPIYPKDYYSEVGTKGFGIKPIGSGPYKIVEVIPGKKVVMEKNEAYFKDSPKGQASIGKIAPEQVEYLQSRGMDEREVISLIIRGFLGADVFGLGAELDSRIEEIAELAGHGEV